MEGGPTLRPHDDRPDPRRMPALGLLACLAQGAPRALTVGIVAISFLPIAIGHRFFMRFLSEQRAERERQGAAASRP
jgi:hypothetical protein